MNQITCAKCGGSIDSNAKFCSHCGASMRVGNKEGGQPPSEGATGNKSKRSGRRDGLIVVGLLAVVTIGFFLFKDRPQRPVEPRTQQAGAGAPHSGQMSQEVLQSLPSDYPGLVQSGNKFYDEGSFAVAAEAYSRALAIDGESPDVRTDYGACLYAMGLPQRAAEEFRTVIRTHPEHSIANFNLGIVYHSMEQQDSARYYWEEYLRLDPNGAPAATARELLAEMDN